MMHRSHTLATIAALVLFTTVAQADDHLPSAREIFDRAVEATHAEKLTEQKMRKITGTFSIPAQGLSGAMTVYSMAPDLNYTEIELAGLGKIRSGHDGTTAWSLDPMQGPQVMEGAAAEQQRIMSNFYATLYRPEDIDAAAVIEKREFKGEEVYAVELTRAGITSTEYFSVESGLLVGSVANLETPMGAVPTTSEATGYEEMGGVLTPTKSVMSMMGMQQIITVESVSTEEFDTSVFDLPAEIAAMVESE